MLTSLRTLRGVGATCSAAAPPRLTPPAIARPKAAPALRPRRSTSAAASGGGDAAVPASDAPLGTACNVLAAAALLKGAAGLVAPGPLVSQTVSAAAGSPVNAALAGVATSVCWIYAAWFVSLKDALEHSRLGSDTYKRLALGVFGLSILLVATTARYSGAFAGGPMSPSFVLGLTAISMFAIGWLGARMYQIGSGGRSPVADAGAIAKQFAANVGSCLTKPANLYSAYYSFLAVSSLGLFAWLFPTDATPLFPGGLDAVGRYLTRGTAVGMWLVGVTAFVLKDAADRGRLGASTFKLLNLALAATIAQQVWFFSTLGSTGVALTEPMWKGILAQGVAGVTVCATAYLTAKKK